MKKLLRNLLVFSMLLVLPFCCVACQSVNAVNRNLDFCRAVNTATRSTVAVEVKISTARNDSRWNAGSGVIYRIDGDDVYVITNWHVICKGEGNLEPGAEIYISPANVKTWVTNRDGGYGYQTQDGCLATLIGGISKEDIAVLKATLPQGFVRRYGLLAANYDLDKPVRYGETVFAVGNAMGLGIAATEGIVSSVGGTEYINGPDLSDENNTVLRRLIRISAAVQQGNSGGGLYNQNAELIGIVQSKLMYYGYGQGEPEYQGYPADNVAFAVPMTLAGRIADQVIARHLQTHEIVGDNLIIKNLGITYAEKDLTVVVDSEGINHYQANVYVVNVEEPTSKLALNDIILTASCHGKTVSITSSEVLRDFLLECWDQTEITLEVMRNAESLTLECALRSD